MLFDSFIKFNAGLLPFAALVYSFLNSWHCSFMCSPFFCGKSAKNESAFLLARIFSYSAVGILMGLFGKLFLSSSSYQLLNFVGFVAFIFITIFFILPQLFPNQKWPNLAKLFFSQKYRTSQSHGAVTQGLLISLMPCHLLAFLYGVSALQTNPALGGLLLFGHAVMTTPALAMPYRFIHSCLRKSGQPFKILLKIFLISSILFNFFVFGSRLFPSEQESQKNILFCGKH